MTAIPPLDVAELYRVLAESTPDAIITIDEGSVILSINPAGERLFGYRAAEVIGRPLTHLMPERYRVPHRDGMQRYLGTRKKNIPWQAVGLPILTKDGREIPAEISFGEFMSGGRVVFSGILRDVSARLAAEATIAANTELLQTQALELEQQVDEAQALSEELEQANQELSEANIALEAREAEYRALANSIPTLAWMARPDGYIIWYNDRWYEYTGTTPEDMQGWGWQSVHDPDVLPAVLERWRASIATGEPFEMTFPLRGADGQLRSFLTRVAPARDAEGHVTRWFGTNTDIDVESQLRREAEAANRAKSDFLGVMSHELRTPLNAIGGYAELMELGLHGPLTGEQREDLQRIQQSQRHLLGLINQVLNYARAESGNVRYDITDVLVSDALAAAEALVTPQIDMRGLTFMYGACNPSVRARADLEKLQQILLNLFTNAIKFTEPRGQIRVACGSRDGVVAISVTDTGVGIAADRLASVFEPFVQVDQRLTRESEGVGLGLSISRDLARGMAGDLTAESTPNVGSTFTLTLPAAPGGPGA